ncbi:MAG TPA: helix-turn-helix transcriptional regulator [Nitrosospira sp.]|jgi:DNA-binding NarL/FixJ family response regulator|nr:helix-turn-helix transcriptional regulator [Nitrosospira sp.]
MDLHAFSRTIERIYAIAEQAAPDRFSSEVLRVIRRLIHFDGAVLATGYLDTKETQRLIIEQAQIFNLDEHMLVDYAMLSGADPIIHALIEGLTKPLVLDQIDFYAQHKLWDLHDFADKYALRKLLLYGDAPNRNRNNAMRWLALYRGTNDDFSKVDAVGAKEFWNHIGQATAINLQHSLEKTDPRRVLRAASLINARGVIEVANPAWNHLLKLELPTYNGRTLPAHVMTSLISTAGHRGKLIAISSSLKFGYLACTARSIHRFERLAPSEMNVADRFAKGMTHTEIALHLRVSPNTVRNQLAQIYQKLGVHSKTELVRVMLSRQRQ